MASSHSRGRRGSARRIGDETRQRIDELADGWSVPADVREIDDELEEAAGDEAEDAAGDETPEAADDEIDTVQGQTPQPQDQETENEDEIETRPVDRVDPQALDRESERTAGRAIGRAVGEAMRAKRDSSAPPLKTSESGGAVQPSERPKRRSSHPLPRPVGARRAKPESHPPPVPERARRASSTPVLAVGAKGDDGERAARESRPPPVPGRGRRPSSSGAERASRDSAPPPPVPKRGRRPSSGAERAGRDSAPPPPGRAGRDSNPPKAPQSAADSGPAHRAGRERDAAPRAKRESRPPPPPGSQGRPGRLSDPTGDPTEHYARDSRGDDSTGLGGDTGPLPDFHAPATLRRKRGLYGDALYVKSVIFGIPGDRRQLNASGEKLAGLRQRRRELLIEIARSALAHSDYDDLENVQDSFVELEEERSRRAGVVAATDEEIAAIERDLEVRLDEIDLEIAELRETRRALDTELKPVEKELGSARRRAADLKGSIDTLEREIQDAEEALAGPENPKQGRDELEASIAAMRADREALLKEGPALAEELDELQPRREQLAESIEDTDSAIAALEDERADREARARESLAALRARKTVEERHERDAQSERDALLLDLGESLAHRRPEYLSTLLVMVDRLDEQIAETELRRNELDERLTAVDTSKLIRGILVWLVALATIAAAVALATSL